MKFSYLIVFTVIQLLCISCDNYRDGIEESNSMQGTEEESSPNLTSASSEFHTETRDSEIIDLKLATLPNGDIDTKEKVQITFRSGVTCQAYVEEIKKWLSPNISNKIIFLDKTEYTYTPTFVFQQKHYVLSEEANFQVKTTFQNGDEKLQRVKGHFFNGKLTEFHSYEGHCQNDEFYGWVKGSMNGAGQDSSVQIRWHENGKVDYSKKFIYDELEYIGDCIFNEEVFLIPHGKGTRCNIKNQGKIQGEFSYGVLKDNTDALVTTIYSDGSISVYNGKTVNGERNGYGHYTYLSKGSENQFFEFKGNFENDNPCDKGELSMSHSVGREREDKYKYNGGVVLIEGIPRPHGEGIMYLYGKNMGIFYYTAEFKNGKPVEGKELTIVYNENEKRVKPMYVGSVFFRDSYLPAPQGLGILGVKKCSSISLEKLKFDERYKTLKGSFSKGTVVGGGKVVGVQYTPLVSYVGQVGDDKANGEGVLKIDFATTGSPQRGNNYIYEYHGDFQNDELIKTNKLVVSVVMNHEIKTSVTYSDCDFKFVSKAKFEEIVQSVITLRRLRTTNKKCFFLEMSLKGYENEKPYLMPCGEVTVTTYENGSMSDGKKEVIYFDN